VRGEDVAAAGVDQGPGAGLDLGLLDGRRRRGGERKQGEERGERGNAEAVPVQRSFSLWPEIRICGSISGFRVSIRTTETPTLWAIAVKVSPFWIT